MGEPGPSAFPQNAAHSVLPPLGPPAANTMNAVPGLPALGPSAAGNLDWFGHDENVNTLNGNEARFGLNAVFAVRFGAELVLSESARNTFFVAILASNWLEFGRQSVCSWFMAARSVSECESVCVRPSGH